MIKPRCILEFACHRIHEKEAVFDTVSLTVLCAGAEKRRCDKRPAQNMVGQRKPKAEELLSCYVGAGCG